jgi:plasmid maintenance system antidote protein VapI
MKHPWQDIIHEIKARGWTQKHFSLLLWKKVSEVNELIKWKRNITIQRDLLLSKVLWFPEKFRINKQIDYDYIIVKQNFVDSKADKIIQKYAKTETQAPMVAEQPDISKSNVKFWKNKKHEGIFRNF